MHRLFVAVLALDVLIAGSSVFAGQQSSASPNRAAASKPAGTSVTPRTSWGDPDLQGLWPSIDMQGTPLERPASFGERAVLTDAEFAAREETTQRQSEADSETTVVQRPRRGGGTGPPSHWGEHGIPTRQASLIVDPPDGRMPPMTREGEQRAKAIHSTYYLDFPDAVDAHAFEQFTDLGPYDRCITRGTLASMLPTGYNMGTQIFQIPGFVVIRNEMIHETRVIPLDGRPHVGSKLRTYMGDSRGHWDGATLVIETTNFNGKVGLTRNGNTTPVTEELKLTERLTRIDATTLRYEATINDPRTWSRPWTVSLPFTIHPEYGMFEYACHEGNYAMKHILSGARAEETAPQPIQ
jgi:hypothetical protein